MKLYLKSNKNFKLDVRIIFIELILRLFLGATFRLWCWSVEEHQNTCDARLDIRLAAVQHADLCMCVTIAD